MGLLEANRHTSFIDRVFALSTCLQVSHNLGARRNWMQNLSIEVQNESDLAHSCESEKTSETLGGGGGSVSLTLLHPRSSVDFIICQDFHYERVCHSDTFSINLGEIQSGIFGPTS